MLIEIAQYDIDKGNKINAVNFEENVMGLSNLVVL